MARKRTAERQAERARSKLRAAARKLWTLSEGGSAARPRKISSPAQVEVDASSTPCPICGGSMRCADHRVVSHGGLRLRAADVDCAQCGERVAIYYVLAEQLLS